MGGPVIVRNVSLFAIAVALPAAVQARDMEAPAAPVAEVEQGDPIVVTGERQGYGAASTRTGTRTNTDLRNVPQAITVISETQIEDQSLRSVADVLLYVPGATPGTGEGNRDQISLRGNNTTADFFIDGIRDDAQYFRDLYNVDRIEVLRGPNAMIFGRGGGGGVVNRVVKRSGDHLYREFALSADSEGGYPADGRCESAARRQRRPEDQWRL